MSNRETNLNKTFIKSILTTRGVIDFLGIVVFDINFPKHPSSCERDSDDVWVDVYPLSNYGCNAKLVINLYLGKVEYCNYIGEPELPPLYKVLKIARQYRPGIGRYDKAVYVSLILKAIIIDRINRSLLNNLRFVDIFKESDYNIKRVILFAYFERHHNPNMTDHNKKRFILIPYSASMRTKPISWTGTGHFVTLIVDLDHIGRNNNFVPFVYVYDSAHMFCKYYGSFNQKLNKVDYFDFGNQILVDDYVLNDDVNRCVCFYVPDNMASKIQYVFRADCRCGYYCEAAINLLLENSTITSNDGILPNGNVLVSGDATRNYLKDILKNDKIQAKLSIINPPLPQQS